MTGSKGMSLIELLVGIACFSIVIVLITGVFISAIQAQEKIKELSKLQSEASYIMDYISRDLRMSNIKNHDYEFVDNKIQKNNKILNTVNATGYINIDEKAYPPKAEIYLKFQKDIYELEVKTTISQRN